MHFCTTELCVAAHYYKDTGYIAACEIMSEPRDKSDRLSSTGVCDFSTRRWRCMARCRALLRQQHRACWDQGRIYYKLWKFDETIIIPKKNNVIYTRIMKINNL